MILPVWVKPVVCIVALLGAAYSGYHYRDIVAQRDTLKFQIAAQEKAKVYTEQLQSIASLVEKQSYENQKKHDAELAYYRDLVKQHGGLYDNGSTSSTNTPSTGGNQASPSGTRLSEEASGFLLEQANKADRVVDQYLQCQKYVESIGGLK